MADEHSNLPKTPVWQTKSHEVNCLYMDIYVLFMIHILLYLGIPPGIITIHRALRHGPENFTQFEDYIRSFIHDVLHWRIGGTMGDKYASRAPEFILHHTFLDKIWSDYQKQSPEHKWVYFKDTNHNIYNTNILAKDMVDNDNLLGTKVCYKDPFESYSDIHKTLKQLDLDTIRSLMTKEAYASPFFQSYLKY